MTIKSILTKILLTSSIFALHSYSQQNTTITPKNQQEVEEVEIDDIGRLPESFDMALDSLLSVRYKQYYSLSKRNQRKLTAEERSRDALYRERVHTMESAIPLTYNSIVQEAIDLYINKRSHLISNMLSKSSYYFPMIEEELDRHNLPLELKYLSIVESALEPTAVSRMGATGLWQFMLQTGKIYNLKINSMIDERCDPRKSTIAMCQYFKDMYALYGDWMLSIAAYNCGPGNVNKAIRRAGGSKDFWVIYPYLPRETRSYVPFFIAAFYSMEYYREHDIKPKMINLPLATDTVHINCKMNFEDISRASNVSVDMLRQLNPQFRKDVVPGNQGLQILIMPSQEAIAFSVDAKDSLRMVALQERELSSAMEEEIVKPEPRKPAYRYHKVRRGETLSTIAAKYRGVTVSKIKKANGLKSSRIVAGQRLKIPN